jgi:hypothetical protein
VYCIKTTSAIVLLKYWLEQSKAPKNIEFGR